VGRRMLLFGDVSRLARRKLIRTQYRVFPHPKLFSIMQEQLSEMQYSFG
jgi:hypothetical protein